GIDVGRLGGLATFLVNCALVISLAWLISRLFWLVLAGVEYRVEPDATAGSRSGVQAIADYSVLERLSPFRAGEAVPQISAQSAAEENAPDTALNLTFHGARLDGDEAGVAYISVGSEPQARFAIGDRIGTQQAVLERIYSDGVILRREGRLEKLQRRNESAIVSLGSRRNSTSIDGVSVADAVPSQGPVANAGQTSAVSTADASNTIETQMLRSDLVELTQSIRLEPREALGYSGYAVYPTRRSFLMAQAGLRPGDIVVSVGGRDMAAYEDLQAALDDLDTSATMTMAIVRDQALVDVNIQVTD
ncbi:MAG: hypothetical protein MRY64_00395, partial [Hyphomonadaceae bacterium]|nr:hypothetical protein [Hyphomonadaceae bacterium]